MSSPIRSGPSLGKLWGQASSLDQVGKSEKKLTKPIIDQEQSERLRQIITQLPQQLEKGDLAAFNVSMEQALHTTSGLLAAAPPAPSANMPGADEEVSAAAVMYDFFKVIAEQLLQLTTVTKAIKPNAQTIQDPDNVSRTLTLADLSAEETSTLSGDSVKVINGKTYVDLSKDDVKMVVHARPEIIPRILTPEQQSQLKELTQKTKVLAIYGINFYSKVSRDTQKQLDQITGG